jgi:hypothetical protein
MKKFLTWLSLGLVLFACVYGAVSMAALPRTMEATIPAYELQQNPNANMESSQSPSGAADAIVRENLSETHAINDVTSIVFDFRGYDTMGEAFILITAVAGSTVILYSMNKKEDDAE